MVGAAVRSEGPVNLERVQQKWELLLRPNAIQRFDSERFQRELADSGKLETALGCGTVARRLGAR